MRGATYARRKKGINRVSEASWRHQENAWFQDRPERQQGAIIFYPRTSLSFPNCSFQAIECNNETATITHVRSKTPRGCSADASGLSSPGRVVGGETCGANRRKIRRSLCSSKRMSRLVSSRAAQVALRVWITAGVSLVSLTLWACRSRAALKYKHATVTSRRCCSSRLFPVTAVWLQGFSGISLDYGAVKRVASRILFIYYFNVFILKIIRPARGFLPLPFGVRWWYLCLRFFCLFVKVLFFMKFINNPKNIIPRRSLVHFKLDCFFFVFNGGFQHLFMYLSSPWTAQK